MDLEDLIKFIASAKSGLKWLNQFRNFDLRTQYKNL